MSLENTMKMIELESENQRLRQMLTMHHNGMVDISIMIEEGDYEEALAKAQSFFVEPEGPKENDNG